VQGELPAAGPSGGVLAKVATGALLASGLAVAGVLSLLLLALVFAVGAVVLGYFAWKTRNLKLRKNEPNVFAAGHLNPGAVPRGNSSEPHTLDGDYIRPKDVCKRTEG
jgi:hypothetical protein